MLFISKLNDSRYTTSLLKKKRRKKIGEKQRKKRKEGTVRSIKLNIIQRAIPAKQSQNERNCPGYRFYQVIISSLNLSRHSLQL